MQMKENRRIRRAVGDHPFHDDAIQPVLFDAHAVRQNERLRKGLALCPALQKRRIRTADQLFDQAADLVDGSVGGHGNRPKWCSAASSMLRITAPCAIRPNCIMHIIRSVPILR